MYRIDLHTHSIASPDGGIKPEQYARLLEDGTLDFIAITDHNTIAQAERLHQSLGTHIIIGEEITTNEGELIGLFLKEEVEPWQSVLDTAEAIKAQGGLIYVPHPFESVRAGLQQPSLDRIADMVDIVEVHNGRAVFQNRRPQAATWARLNHKVIAASSDAHGLKGMGTTYTLVVEVPARNNICAQLEQARFVIKRPPLYTLLYPKMYRLKKRMGR